MADCQKQVLVLQSLHSTMNSAVLRQLAADANFQEQLDDQTRQIASQRRFCSDPATGTTQVLSNCPERVELENQLVRQEPEPL